jgi:hypothetical protein
MQWVAITDMQWAACLETGSRFSRTQDGMGIQEGGDEVQGCGPIDSVIEDEGWERGLGWWESKDLYDLGNAILALWKRTQPSLVLLSAAVKRWGGMSKCLRSNLCCLVSINLYLSNFHIWVLSSARSWSFLWAGLVKCWSLCFCFSFLPEAMVTSQTMYNANVDTKLLGGYKMNPRTEMFLSALF